ncbi:MAG: type II toxin-antitoxin system RelB/DinJ family antitoxin [Cellulosilyticaceae bacterium]
MAQTTLSVRMDENVKKQFDAFCNEVGMNASVAINLFAKAVLRERRIPFEIGLGDDPFYSEVNQARLAKAIENMDAGFSTAHDLIEVEDD